MNYLNYNPFELAAKLILQRNARIRDFVGPRGIVRGGRMPLPNQRT